jgi:Ca2+-binding RTX toxin-like protein
MAKRLSPFQLSGANLDGRSDGAAFARGLFAPSPAAQAIMGPPGPQALLAPFSGPILTSSLNGVDGFRIEGDVAQDQAGTVVTGLGDINNDGFDDFGIGVPGDDQGGTDAGAAYVIFGNALGFSNFALSALGAGGFKIVGDAAGDAAATIAGAGDVNNDGFDDIIVGAPGAASGAGANSGAAYVIFGKASGFGTIDLGALAAADGFKIQGHGPNDILGSSVASAGDINNDGFDDIVVGAPNGAGNAYVIFGKASGFGTIDVFTLAPPDGFALIGQTAGGGGGAFVPNAGTSVAPAGDFNNDGFADYLVSQPGNNQGVVLLLGKASGFVSAPLYGAGLGLITEAATSTGPTQDSLGFSVSGAGDVNGDGYDDIIVGAYRNDQGGGDAGAAYVIFGRASVPAYLDLAHFSIADGFKIIGAAGSDIAGYSVSGAGDVNGDGFADILVSAPLHDFGTGDRGAVYLIFGRADGFRDIDLRQALVPADGIRIDRDDGFQTSGSVSAAGDINGDGFDDLIMGSPMHDSTLDNVGAAYVIYGRAGFGGTQILGTPGNDDPLFGTAGMDDMRGLAGNDYLEGYGGGDRMEGGQGNDILVVDEASDVAFEAIGEGSDTLYTSVSYTLNRGAEIELLAARDNQSLDALTLTGNAFANAILGNSGSNIIDGGGGGDVMVGYGGDDTYYIRTVADQVFEAAGGGSDKVFTTFDFRMAADQEIEEVAIISSTSTNNIYLIGNDGANILRANNGNNTIIGGDGADQLFGYGGNDYLDGGAGADVITLGTGSSIVVADQIGDVVNGASANDIVYTSGSFTMTANNVAPLLARDNQDTTALQLTGNALNNTILANNGDNYLDGKDGRDLLVGYGGADTFAFTTTLADFGLANVDTIFGFSAADDTIALDDAVFAGLGLGALSASVFVTGTAAGDADDRILYDSATGKLYFDIDGTGSVAPVQFAVLDGAPVISASDFVVI